MEEKQRDILSGRIKDLAGRAFNNSFITHTDFLSLSELAAFFQILSSEGISSNVHEYMGAHYVIYGGFPDAERAMICFLPDYISEEEFLAQQSAEPDVLACIHVTPLKEKFSDDLNHRDYLGALMNLGIERDQIGDILTGEKEAYIFTTTEVADTVCRELIRIRHTSVKCLKVNGSECDIRPRFEEVSGSVASERTDAVIAFVYNLSRAEAQRLIEAEQVFIDGRTAYSGGYDLKIGARGSVRGKGKFIYDGPGGTPRKGRLFFKGRKFI